MPPLTNTNTTLNTSSPNVTPTTSLLSLPTEIRIQIYTYILSTSNIHSLRPQRKIGWNRPHADLSNPALLFDSDAPVALRQLFTSKLTKGDHALILATVLDHVRVLVVDHADFTALLKIVKGSGVVTGIGTGTGTGAGLSHTQPGTTTSVLAPTQPASKAQNRSHSHSLASVVRTHLRTIDFSDRMDDIVCQPNDIVKLIAGLPGLRSVCLTSRHVQRYSGTVEDHVEFTRQRGAQDERAASSFSVDVVVPVNGQHGPSCDGNSHSNDHDPNSADCASEIRRLTLRSPMTDGTRMMISPALFTRSLLSPKSISASTNGNPHKPPSNPINQTWIPVDLSHLIWQHFLYTGPPYRDHWRTMRMTTLLEVAERCGVDVILGVRGVEFDPLVWVDGGEGTGRQSGRGRKGAGGAFRGVMSTADWVLRLRGVGRAVKGRGKTDEYCVRQRRVWDERVGQGGVEGAIERV